MEYKVDFGPGYRIYFGKDGERLVLLLGGGTKQRQNHDIEQAQNDWREYKQAKKSASKPVAQQATLLAAKTKQSKRK